MCYAYKVVPFIGHNKGGLSAADVAAQLEEIITFHANQGWEFHQLSDVNIEVQPGCIAGLLGAEVQYARFDQLIFRTERITEDAVASAQPSPPVNSGVRRELSMTQAPEWRCACGQRNPGSTNACLDCGRSR